MGINAVGSSGPIKPWMRRSREAHSPVIPQSINVEGPSLSTLLRGKAIGGPRDGAKIEAPRGWDGLIRYQVGKMERLRPGRYVYTIVDGEYAWVWKENTNKP